MDTAVLLVYKSVHTTLSSLVNVFSPRTCQKGDWSEGLNVLTQANCGIS